MPEPENAVAITIDGAPDFPSDVLKALYRITARSSTELRRSIQSREPVYTAALFGNDHIEVVPRLERVTAFLAEFGIPFVVHEWTDGEREEISLETMRNILEAAGGESA